MRVKRASNTGSSWKRGWLFCHTALTAFFSLSWRRGVAGTANQSVVRFAARVAVVQGAGPFLWSQRLPLRKKKGPDFTPKPHRQTVSKNT